MGKNYRHLKTNRSDLQLYCKEKIYIDKGDDSETLKGIK